LEGLLAMRLSHNTNFQRHKEQIQEALDSLKESDEVKNGRIIFSDMLRAAESLDLLFTPDSDVMPSQQIITMRRDEFHKRCKIMGEWLTQNAPDLRLEWI